MNVCGISKRPNFRMNPIDHDHNQSSSDHESDERNLLILYATETGTAQDAADRVARECRRIHFRCRLSSMHAYPLASGPSVSKKLNAL